MALRVDCPPRKLRRISCNIPGCDRKHWAKGLCHRHDTYFRRTGRVAPLVAEERFFKYLLLAETGCWLWLSRINKRGYATFWSGNATVSAHRWAYAHFRGVPPKDLTLDHLCRVRSCVNPWHMESVTRWENVRRGNTITGNNSRKTHCKWGHPLERDNIYVSYFERTRERRCKTCAGNGAKCYGPTQLSIGL